MGVGVIYVHGDDGVDEDAPHDALVLRAIMASNSPGWRRRIPNRMSPPGEVEFFVPPRRQQIVIKTT